VTAANREPGAEIDRSQELADLAKELVGAAARRGMAVRLCGGAAVWEHCGAARERLRRGGRRLRDIDLAARLRDRGALHALLTELGFQLDPRLGGVPEMRRAIYHRVREGRLDCKCDIYFERMECCHVIDLRGRLEADCPTIPLAELLLSKLQIVRLTSRDLQDIHALLWEHELGESDLESFDTRVLSAAFVRSWGLCRTVAQTLSAVERAAAEGFDAVQREVILGRILRLRELLEGSQKSIGWRCRAWLGRVMPGLRWYQEVEELEGPLNMDGDAHG
jgi:hypothetical protein